MSNIILRVAAKAVIVNDKNEVLLVRESRTYGDGTQLGKYGIPGGRLEEGESYSDGLIREAFEETGLQVAANYPIYVGEWHPEIKGVKHQIIAIFTVCKTKITDVKLSEEHDDYQWVSLRSIEKLDVVEPDRSVALIFLRTRQS